MKKEFSFIVSFFMIFLVYTQEVIPVDTTIDSPINSTFYYGFEASGSTAKWSTSQLDIWSVSTNKKIQGAQSLKVSIQSNDSAIQSFVTHIPFLK